MGGSCRYHVFDETVRMMVVGVTSSRPGPGRGSSPDPHRASEPARGGGSPQALTCCHCFALVCPRNKTQTVGTFPGLCRKIGKGIIYFKQIIIYYARPSSSCSLNTTCSEVAFLKSSVYAMGLQAPFPDVQSRLWLFDDRTYSPCI